MLTEIKVTLADIGDSLEHDTDAIETSIGRVVRDGVLVMPGAQFVTLLDKFNGRKARVSLPEEAIEFERQQTQTYEALFPFTFTLDIPVEYLRNQPSKEEGGETP